MNEERLNEILATAKHAAYAHPGCYGLDRAAIELVAEVQRLQKAIWPGLPKWKPTSEQPQQDFHEAVIEDLREGSSKWDSANSALDNIPERFTKWIDTWMAANQLRANQIRYGCFPLGMVQNWVERAEKAEKELEEAKIEIHNLKAELEHSHEYVEELCEHDMIDKKPCEYPGCTNLGFACFMEVGDEEPSGFWCPDHCFGEGFCFMCGYFYAGIGSFEFGEGMCDGCAAEVENDYDDSEVDYE